MFGRQERVALLLLLTVAGVVVAAHLTLDYLGKRPFATPYSSESRPGDLVSISGTIEGVTPTRTGGHLILAVHNSTVFLPNQVATGLDLQKGVNISAIGTVQAYQGAMEIVIRSHSDITVIP